MAKKTILYVEDELWQMSGVGDRLSANYNVIEARNGDQALAYLESGEHKIDLILLDIMMPLGERIRTPDRGRTAGVEFARIVLMEKGLEIPIVCYTVVNEPVVHDALYQLGVKAIVLKKKLPSELERVIEKHLR
jgi:CheY-like chemotaxis protein